MNIWRPHFVRKGVLGSYGYRFQRAYEERYLEKKKDDKSIRDEYMVGEEGKP